jgi:hypothetical protein
VEAKARTFSVFSHLASLALAGRGA